MEELIDELSGATIDGEANKDVPMKSKIQKQVNRTASIITRSKLLILSDSETDDEDVLNKRQFAKYLRISKQKNNAWKVKVHPQTMSKGKRKRNSGSENATTSGNHSILNNSSIRSNIDSMEVESNSSSTELSDDCHTDNFDGDDEQSDFYDSCSKSSAPRYTNRNFRNHSKSKLEFKIPSKPANPFSFIDFETYLSPSINLCKRRRPLH